MWADIDARISRAMAGIRRAFRGRLSRVNSGLNIQQVQVNGLAGEVVQDAELFQHFGFTSNPPANTQCVIVPIGGRTSHSIIVATENEKYRITALESGEVAIYSSEGAFVKIKKGRIVDVECDTYNVKCKNYNVTCEENFDVSCDAYKTKASVIAEFDTPELKSTQEIADGKSTMSEMRKVYDDHDHHENGDGGGITDAPTSKM